MRFFLYLGADVKIKYIYDSFMDLDEKELFLCHTEDNKIVWFAKHDVPKTLLTPFLKKKIKDKITTSTELEEDECTVDKEDAYACDMKCKSRGVQIACTNCGILSGYKEMYASESLTQVGNLTLDMHDNYLGTY